MVVGYVRSTVGVGDDEESLVTTNSREAINTKSKKDQPATANQGKVTFGRGADKAALKALIS